MLAVITVGREPSWLNRLVMEFVRCLDFGYVIVAGCVAILLGRTRTTDDVDVVVDAASGAEVAARAARCGFKPLTLESNLTTSSDTHRSGSTSRPRPCLTSK